MKQKFQYFSYYTERLTRTHLPCQSSNLLRKFFLIVVTPAHYANSMQYVLIAT